MLPSKEDLDFFNNRLRPDSWTVEISSFVALAATFGVVIHTRRLRRQLKAGTEDVPGAAKKWKQLRFFSLSSTVLIILWIVVPPLLFAGDYFRYRLCADRLIESPKSDRLTFLCPPSVVPNREVFEYGQEMAARIWEASVAVLIFIRSGKLGES